MNTDNLHELINRYTANYALFNSEEHNEIFKWRAVQCFRSVWFSEAAKTLPFDRLFAQARKESAVLIDNRQVSPTNPTREGSKGACRKSRCLERTDRRYGGTACHVCGCRPRRR